LGEFTVDHLSGRIAMSDIYSSEINALSGERRSAGEERLSRRAALFAALALSLLFWAPLLLPMLMLLHS
jgi:hypothetical protein